MAKPCSDCPFRKDSMPGWIGTFDGADELRRAALSETPFGCHTRGGHVTNQTDLLQPQCVGRLVFTRKCAKRFRSPALAEMQDVAVRFTNPDTVLGMKEFEEHHGGSNA